MYNSTIVAPLEPAIIIKFPANVAVEMPDPISANSIMVVADVDCQVSFRVDPKFGMFLPARTPIHYAVPLPTDKVSVYAKVPGVLYILRTSGY